MSSFSEFCVIFSFRCFDPRISIAILLLSSGDINRLSKKAIQKATKNPEGAITAALT